MSAHFKSRLLLAYLSSPSGGSKIYEGAQRDPNFQKWGPLKENRGHRFAVNQHRWATIGVEAKKSSKMFVLAQLFGPYFPDQIELVGDKPLRHILDELGSWPVVISDWAGASWDLIQVLASMRGLYNAPILIDAWVAADDKNSSVNIIQVRFLHIWTATFHYLKVKISLKMYWLSYHIQWSSTTTKF